jgi:hypothetical protein
MVFVLKDWSKDGLARKLADLLDPYPPASIVSIESGVDFQFFLPWPQSLAGGFARVRRRA